MYVKTITAKKKSHYMLRITNNYFFIALVTLVQLLIESILNTYKRKDELMTPKFTRIHSSNNIFMTVVRTKFKILILDTHYFIRHNEICIAI